jgi:nucleoside-diphosphate-sugar epimerase
LRRRKHFRLKSEVKIFVTGATGFLGSHFVRVALEAGHQVTALRRNEDSQPRIPLPTALSWLNKGLAEVAEHDLAAHDVFVHLAAAGVDLRSGWQECFRVNVSESLDLWIKAARAGVGQFLIAGSCFEYGRSGERYDFIPPDAPLEPVTAYGASKAAASIAALGLAAELDLKLSVVRPFHIYGEGEGEGRFWPSLRRAALAGQDFDMTAGEQLRDFAPVNMIAKGLLRACAHRVKPGIPVVRNLGTGQPQSLRDFAEEWWNRWGATGQLRLGVKPYRRGEVMRYVPLLSRPFGNG